MNAFGVAWFAGSGLILIGAIRSSRGHIREATTDLLHSQACADISSLKLAHADLKAKKPQHWEALRRCMNAHSEIQASFWIHWAVTTGFMVALAYLLHAACIDRLAINEQRSEIVAMALPLALFCLLPAVPLLSRARLETLALRATRLYASVDHMRERLARDRGVLATKTLPPDYWLRPGVSQSSSSQRSWTSLLSGTIGFFSEQVFRRLVAMGQVLEQGLATTGPSNRVLRVGTALRHLLPEWLITRTHDKHLLTQLEGTSHSVCQRRAAWVLTPLRAWLVQLGVPARAVKRAEMRKAVISSVNASPCDLDSLLRDAKGLHVGNLHSRIMTSYKSCLESDDPSNPRTVAGQGRRVGVKLRGQLRGEHAEIAVKIRGLTLERTESQPAPVGALLRIETRDVRILDDILVNRTLVLSTGEWETSGCVTWLRPKKNFLVDYVEAGFVGDKHELYETSPFPEEAMEGLPCIESLFADAT